MKLTRAQLVEKGKVWTVYLDKEPDTILFEGTKTAAFKYVTKHFGMRLYKRGYIRVSKILWENLNENI